MFGNLLKSGTHSTAGISHLNLAGKNVVGKSISMRLQPSIKLRSGYVVQNTMEILHIVVELGLIVNNNYLTPDSITKSVMKEKTSL